MSAAAFDLGPKRRGRRPGLTPMIDVVFLLLVFFMLAARFGPEARLALEAGAPGAADWRGPPRLIDVHPDGMRLNGVPVTPGALAAALSALLDSPGDPVVLRARDGADLQQLVAAIAALQAAGHANLLMVE